MTMACRPPCSWAQRTQHVCSASAQLQSVPTCTSSAIYSSPWSGGVKLKESRRRWVCRWNSVPDGSTGGIGRGSIRASLAAEEAPSKLDLSGLKAELLSLVAGLDRGLLATPADLDAVNSSARKLEEAGNAVEFPDDLDLLQGRWRLVYSSAFSGSFGGQRPGPPIGRLLPLTLGQAYQRIDILTRQCDNIVDLRIATPWPLPPLEVTATLAHTFELTGGRSISIVFERTIAKAGGGLSELPPLEIPQLPDFLRPSTTGVRSAEFDNTFVDDDMRISRGDRGELRVYVKT